MKCLWCGKDFEPANKGQLFCKDHRTRAGKVPRTVRVQAAKDAAANRGQTIT